MKEIWKDIIEYENFYLVSNLGRIKSLRTTAIKKNSFNKKRYNIVSLSKFGEQKTKIVHRLVAQAFIPNPNNLPQVNHKDGNKQNNRVDNLEWVTNRENRDHAIKNGLVANTRGIKNGMSILTETEVKIIRDLFFIKKLKQSEIGRIFNVSRQVIHHIIKNNTWRYI